MTFMSSKEVSLLAEQNLNFMNYFDTPEYKLHPPKEDLVETVSFFALRP